MDKEQLKMITDCITEYANALSAENVELIKMGHIDKCYCISKNVEDLALVIMKDKSKLIIELTQLFIIPFTICFIAFILYLWAKI